MIDLETGEHLADAIEGPTTASSGRQRQRDLLLQRARRRTDPTASTATRWERPRPTTRWSSRSRTSASSSRSTKTRRASASDRAAAAVEHVGRGLAAADANESDRASPQSIAEATATRSSTGVEHARDTIYVMTNEDAVNFKPDGSARSTSSVREHWNEAIPHDPADQARGRSRRSRLPRRQPSAQRV